MESSVTAEGLMVMDSTNPQRSLEAESKVQSKSK